MSMQFLQIQNVGFWNSTEENKSWPFLKGKGTVKGLTRQSPSIRWSVYLQIRPRAFPFAMEPSVNCVSFFGRFLKGWWLKVTDIPAGVKNCLFQKPVFL